MGAGETLQGVPARPPHQGVADAVGQAVEGEDGDPVAQRGQVAHVAVEARRLHPQGACDGRQGHRVETVGVGELAARWTTAAAVSGGRGTFLRYTGFHLMAVGSDPAVPLRDVDGVRPAPRVQLVGDHGEVVADGPLGQRQPVRRLAHRAPLGHETQHLGLARGQRGVPPLHGGRGEFGVQDAAPAATRRIPSTSSSTGAFFSTNPSTPAARAPRTAAGRPAP